MPLVYELRDTFSPLARPPVVMMVAKAAVAVVHALTPRRPAMIPVSAMTSAPTQVVFHGDVTVLSAKHHVVVRGREGLSEFE